MTGFASAQSSTLPVYNQGGTVLTAASPGHPSTYGNNNYLNGTATKGPVANPTPGTMVIHLGFIVLSEATAAWSSVDTANTGTKVNPLGMETYVRIYPGVDAMAANGLRYGAAVEIRQNFFGNTGATTSAVPSASVGGAGGTFESTAQTLFVRREFVYLGADNVGVVRIGETDGVIGTFDEGGSTTGVFLSPSGTIVGGDLQGTGVAAGSGWMTPYFGAQSGNEYATEKVFYDSPSFYGFDIAAQYSPHPFNGFGTAGGCIAGGAPDCPALSSSPFVGSGSIETNIYAAGVRYQGHLGPASVLLYGTYMGSGHVNYTGSAKAAAAAGPAGNGYSGQFDDLSLGMFGANVTVAGLSVFGNVMTGAYNGVLAPKPAGAPDATGFGAGVKYAFGPWTIGGVYSQYDSQGAVALTGISQSHAWVGYFAATYTAAPGLTFYADYGYGQSHQGGYNFATGAVGTSANNSVRTQAFLVGTAITW
ncbi:MAG: porin [Proteobacteria bacterium]|nr:porin [Pseudomonadota bacterium]